MTALEHRYQIIAPLARGGMGEILLARRLGAAGFEKLVVLKRPLHTAGQRVLVTALIEEARLLARINHPNVCQVHDLEQAGDEFFFTMEYLEGLSMWSMLTAAEAAGHPIDPRMVCGLFEQACDGLDAIHAMQTPDGGRIVHRDVSPGNLFVTDRGVVKVLDLGIAKSSDAEEHTPFGRVKGKLGYLSPEQAAGQPIDHRSDLFSLGLVLHDVALARRPDPGRIGALAAGSLDVTAIPPPLADVLRRAIAQQPSDRFATARDMAGALRNAATALGGAPAQREIAAWLAEQFASELANRRAIAQGAIGSGDTSARTQILSLRSVSGVSLAEVQRAMPSLHTAHTERLDVPSRERLTPTPGGELITRPAERHGRMSMIAIAAFAGAIALGAWAAVRQSRGSPDATPAVAVPDGARPSPVPPPPVAAAVERAPLAAPLSVPTFPTAVPTAAPAIRPQATDSPPAGDPPPTAPPTQASPASARPTVPETTRPPPAAPPTAASTTDSPPAPTPRAAVGSSRFHKPRHPSAVTAPGQLTIDSQPFAEISIGSRVLGQTPLWRVPLPPGRYRIHATTEGHREQYVTLQLEAGVENRVILNWSHL